MSQATKICLFDDEALLGGELLKDGKDQLSAFLVPGFLPYFRLLAGRVLFTFCL